jgi:hypothetical protein
MGLQDFFWNFHPFNSKMGNFFSVRILGVDGEIWVTNQQNTRVRSTIQRKKIINFQKETSFITKAKNRYHLSMKTSKPNCMGGTLNVDFQNSFPNLIKKKLYGYP